MSTIPLLTGPQILAALLTAFPTQADWERLVGFGLGQPLDQLAVGRNLQEIAWRVCAWAESHDRLGDLLTAAGTQNPDNAQLQAVLATWLAQPPGARYFGGGGPDTLPS